MCKIVNIEGEEKDVLTRTLCEKVLDSYQKFSIQLVNTKQVKNGQVFLMMIFLFNGLFYSIHFFTYYTIKAYQQFKRL